MNYLIWKFLCNGHRTLSWKVIWGFTINKNTSNMFKQKKCCIKFSFILKLLFGVQLQWHQKKNSDTKKSCSKVAKFTGKIRIDLTIIFSYGFFFCVTFSFSDMVNFLFNLNNFLFLKKFGRDFSKHDSDVNQWG